MTALSHRLEWYKALSPLIVTIVGAYAAYRFVDQHNQALSERAQKLKQVEVETQLRYALIKDYLSLPADTSRSRLDMLRFIAKTDDREEVRAWATATSNEIRDELDEAAMQAQYFRNSAVLTCNSAAGTALLPGQKELHCVIDRRSIGGSTDRVTVHDPIAPDASESHARARCKEVAESLCAEKALTADRCSVLQFEIIAPP